MGEVESAGTGAFPRPPKGARGQVLQQWEPRGEVGQEALAVPPPTALIDEGAFEEGGVGDTGGG